VVPGTAAGYLLAEQFRRLLADLGVLPAGLPLAFGPVPALGTALLLLATVQVAARAASWRASRLPATEAVAESRVEPRRPARWRGPAGLLVLAGAATLAAGPLLARSPETAAATSMAGLVALIGLALAGPALVAAAGRGLARWLPRRASAPTWLAVANLRGYPLRLSGAITTLAMAVVFTLTYVLAQTTLLTATADERAAVTGTAVQVRADALGGVPADLPAAVAAVPGVRAVAPVGRTTVSWPYRMLGDAEVETAPAQVLTPEAAGVLDLDVRAGRLADLTGATVAVGADVARSRDAGLGRTVELVLGDGARVRARVVAVYGRALGLGPVVVSRDLAADHVAVPLPSALLVDTGGPGPAADRLAALVAARPGVTLTGGALDPGARAVPPETWINLAVVSALLGYLLLGIANRLVAATVQRRPELDVLRLVGATPRQVAAMMRREAGLIWAGAVAGGVTLATVPLALLGAGFLGRPWAAGPWWLLPATVLVVGGIAGLAVELPTRRLLRGGVAG
jgi:putative ABC transport system permease protein